MKKEKKKDKEEKKEKKEKKPKANQDLNALEENLVNDQNHVIDNTLMYQLLASNQHIKIVTNLTQKNTKVPKFIFQKIHFQTYLVRPNYMNFNQIMINIRLSNVSAKSAKQSNQIHSIELNVLNTANLKLIRNEALDLKNFNKYFKKIA